MFNRTDKSRTRQIFPNTFYARVFRSRTNAVANVQGDHRRRRADQRSTCTNQNHLSKYLDPLSNLNRNILATSNLLSFAIRIFLAAKSR